MRIEDQACSNQTFEKHLNATAISLRTGDWPLVQKGIAANLLPWTNN